MVIVLGLFTRDPCRCVTQRSGVCLPLCGWRGRRGRPEGPAHGRRLERKWRFALELGVDLRFAVSLLGVGQVSCQCRLFPTKIPGPGGPLGRPTPPECEGIPLPPVEFGQPGRPEHVCEESTSQWTAGHKHPRQPPPRIRRPGLSRLPQLPNPRPADDRRVNWEPPTDTDSPRKSEEPTKSPPFCEAFWLVPRGDPAQGTADQSCQTRCSQAMIDLCF